jgi:dTDP-4-dehydrorhamnose 3,5-epimerase
MKKESETLEFISGGKSVDDRGSVVFCNEFDFKKIRRFYQVTNHRSGFVRAWHGHKNESKYLFVARGTVIVAAVQVQEWQSPDPDANIERYVLSDVDPGVLFIPPGYAHGYKTLTPDATIQFFSTATLNESKGDDYRFDAYFWNPWNVTER